MTHVLELPISAALLLALAVAMLAWSPRSGSAGRAVFCLGLLGSLSILWTSTGSAAPATIAPRAGATLWILAQLGEAFALRPTRFLGPSTGLRLLLASGGLIAVTGEDVLELFLALELVALARLGLPARGSARPPGDRVGLHLIGTSLLSFGVASWYARSTGTSFTDEPMAVGSMGAWAPVLLLLGIVLRATSPDERTRRGYGFATAGSWTLGAFTAWSLCRGATLSELERARVEALWDVLALLALAVMMAALLRCRRFTDAVNLGRGLAFAAGAAVMPAALADHDAGAEALVLLGVTVLTATAVASLLTDPRRRTHSKCGALAAALTLASLIGLPLTAGFWARFRTVQVAAEVDQWLVAATVIAVPALGAATWARPLRRWIHGARGRPRTREVLALGFAALAIAAGVRPDLPWTWLGG